MYSTPTPIGRPGGVGGLGGGSKLTRPRVSLGTNFTSPTLSTSTQNNKTVLGRKSATTSPAMISSPGSRTTTQQVNTPPLPGGSPESIRVGDTVRAPSGEVGTVR
jgi:hypothetical protein